MTGIEVPTLGSIVAAIKFLFETIGQGISMSARQKSLWFTHHIQGSYDEICQIHQDYTLSFQKCLNSLMQNANLNEAIQILQAERPKKLLKRQEVVENLSKLRDYRMQRRRVPKVIGTFYQYVASVEEYLHSASPIPQETWYARFIARFTSLVERGKDPMTDDYRGMAQGLDAPRLAIESLQNAIQTSMPESLRQVQKNFASLRVQCLPNV